MIYFITFGGKPGKAKPNSAKALNLRDTCKKHWKQIYLRSPDIDAGEKPEDPRKPTKTSLD